MRILVDIGHPAHVHLFKNMIWNLEENGHEVKITAKDRGIIFKLLETYGFLYEKVDIDRDSLPNKAFGLLIREFKIFNIVKKFKPDISVAMGPINLAHVSKLLNIPCISFTDTEHDRFERLLSDPFVNAICTPSCFNKDLGKKQVRYNGRHELAYLHPNHFKPDPSVLEDLGLNKDDKFVVIRFVSWNAGHDTNQKGFNLETKKKLINEIEKRAHVFITSEKVPTKDFEKYEITIPPEKMHDLLFYATMYIGEGATMATEAVVLGTPAIYINTQKSGCLGELDDRYKMVYKFSSFENAQKQVIIKAIELLEDKKLKENWQMKREKFMDEMIDVTKFMTYFIESYPDSFQEMKYNPKYQDRFM
jgi:predicted glycosyltransferase